jgi:hypothetical protein
MQAVGNGEDNVKIQHGHHLLFSSLNPLLTLLLLALGTMTVTTAVIADDYLSALWTLVNVSS